MIRTIVSTLALLLLIGATVRAEPPRITSFIDVPYVADGDSAQVLDLYIPENVKPLPLIVWIHGGGWEGGSKKGGPVGGFVAAGYAAASIEYRFSQKAKFPAQIQDCQAAIRFLRANAKKYNIDPNHIGVAGASAGGHLVALLGTAGGTNTFPPIGGNEKESDRVQAVCDLFGPADFSTFIAHASANTEAKNLFNFNVNDPLSKLIGAKLDDREKTAAVSPVTYVTKDDAPFLILHGTADNLVPYSQSVQLAEVLKAAGVEVTLQKFPGGGHGGPVFGSPEVVQLIQRFFDKHLKGVDAKIEPIPEERVTVKPTTKPVK